MKVAISMQQQRDFASGPLVIIFSTLELDSSDAGQGDGRPVES